MIHAVILICGYNKDVLGKVSTTWPNLFL